MLRTLSRKVSRGLANTQNDLLSLLGRVRGQKPRPYTRGSGREPASARRIAPKKAWGAGVRKVATRPLTITRVVRETPDAVSLYLTEADGSPLRFTAGQFLSVDVAVGGETLRRAYSLASAALPGHEAHITVKRIPDGRVSHHLNEHAVADTTLAVLGPSGNFTVSPDPVRERHAVLLAGGSGITPVMSIAHTLLLAEPKSRVTLVYGNRGEGDIIFRERLARLAEEHGARLIVDHVLSDPPAGWTGGRGLLDTATIEARLAHLGVRDDSSTEYFVCGPTPMMDAAHAALGARSVPAGRIHEERFTRPEAREHTDHPAVDAELTVRADGKETKVIAKAGLTLLEAGLSAGLPMPFSCAMGGCGACRVKLVAGEVIMDEPNCLSAAEHEEGYVLTCCSTAASPVTVEIY